LDVKIINGTSILFFTLNFAVLGFAVGLPTATRCLEISSVLPEEISARRSKLPRVSGALQMKSVSQKAAFLKSKE